MQFTLRRLFAIITGVAIVLAVGLWFTVTWRRQLAVQADLRAQGASWVGFPTQASNDLPNVLYTKPLESDVRHHTRLGVVEFKGYDVTPTCIDHLSKLESIAGLRFMSCDLCDDDLVHLPKVKAASLVFWNADITDASIETISRVAGLERVSFKATSVTPQGVENLRRLLPELKVVSAP